jgi:hypothetical protein
MTVYSVVFLRLNAIPLTGPGTPLPQRNPNRMEGIMPNQVLNTGTAAVCEGCSKSPYWCATGYACSVYSDPRKTAGYRHGECAFNQKFVKVVGPRVRAGQQKQRKV